MYFIRLEIKVEIACDPALKNPSVGSSRAPEAPERAARLMKHGGHGWNRRRHNV
jgi:hypothetical protein